MSDDVKFVLQFFLVVSIIIAFLVVLFIGLDRLEDSVEASFCQKFIDANLDEEFAVVEGTCSVLYHDVWVDVQSFDFLLPDLTE